MGLSMIKSLRFLRGFLLGGLLEGPGVNEQGAQMATAISLRCAVPCAPATAACRRRPCLHERAASTNANTSGRTMPSGQATAAC